jgi:phosphoesterase RecJ-like protein
MGSMLALYSILSLNNKSVDMFIDDVLPERYSFLPFFQSIKPFSASKNYDCLFALDCGDPERLGKCKELISKATVVVNIDHHISNYMYGTVNLLETNASSTGEILYDIFAENNYEINKDTAICLYTSILTDTGGFKYSNTTSKTLNVAGELIDTGIDFSEIYSIVYDRKSIGQVKLMSRVISTLDLALDNRVALLSLFPSMLKECGAKEEDASEFINISRDIDGVEVAVFIKEKASELFRISLRSKSKVDVRRISERFGGGGHVRAAGCTIEGNYEKVKIMLIDEIKKHMDVIG